MVLCVLTSMESFKALTFDFGKEEYMYAANQQALYHPLESKMITNLDRTVND